MTDLKVQGEITLNPAGAVAGVNTTRKSLDTLGPSAAAAAKQASAGLDGIGAGGAAAAGKVDVATRNMQLSLQRLIATTEAGEKGSRSFFESLASQRGIDLNALRPYLDQLDQVREKREAAAAAAAKTAQGDGFLSSLREQIRTMAQGTDEMLRYKAAQAGVSAEAGPLIMQLQNMRAAQEANAQAARDEAKAQREAAAAMAGRTSFVDNLRQQADSIGKTRSQLLEMQAAQLGVTKEAAPFIARIRESEVGVGKLGVSAGQTRAALAQLPAQFSDIFVSLQGGQKPFTVLFQQGSQIKDSFGGIGAAAKAMGGYLLGLVNPYTVAAAAATVFAVALYQGNNETQAYAKSLVITGNYLGTTVSQLQNTATLISKTVGTQGAAAESLVALADSGKIASGALAEVGTASVYMQRVMGLTAEKASDVFEKLADEPTKASAKLNESMHYLNLSTYERIRALEDQGNKEGATALAQSALATALTQRLQTVEQQAGSLERGWRALADGAKGAWDAMLGVGRTQSIGDRLSVAQGKLQEMQGQAGRSGAFASFYGPAIAKQQQEIADLSRQAFREQENAAAQGEKARTDQAQIGASARLKVLTDEIKSNKDKRTKALEDLKNDYKVLGKDASGAEFDKLVANINEKYKDPKAPKEKAYQDDAATKMLETLRQQGAALDEQLLSAGKMTDAEREQAKFVQLIADLKSKTILTAEQKSILARADELKAAHELNVLKEREVGFQKILADDSKRRADAERATANAVTGNRVRIADNLSQQREQSDDRLGVIGLGSEAAEQLRTRQQIEREYMRMQSQLTKTASENATLESDAYKQGVQDIATARAQALQINANYFEQLKLKQGDWSLGASQAIANYADESANVFKQTQQLVTNAFGSMEDALVSFVTTGKLDFKSLANSIIADIVRIQVRAALTSAAGSSGGLGKLFGAGASLFGGSATAAFSQTSVGASGFGTGAAYGNLDFGGFFADGGDPPVGKVSVVGERGRELFVPKVPGTIIPNHELGMGGGGLTINNNAPMQITKARLEPGPDGRPMLTIEEIVDQWADPNSMMNQRFERAWKAERNL